MMNDDTMKGGASAPRSDDVVHDVITLPEAVAWSGWSREGLFVRLLYEDRLRPVSGMRKAGKSWLISVKFFLSVIPNPKGVRPDDAE